MADTSPGNVRSCNHESAFVFKANILEVEPVLDLFTKLVALAGSMPSAIMELAMHAALFVFNIG